jgi:hypothetical protein
MWFDFGCSVSNVEHKNMGSLSMAGGRSVNVGYAYGKMENNTNGYVHGI